MLGLSILKSKVVIIKNKGVGTAGPYSGDIKKGGKSGSKKK